MTKPTSNELRDQLATAVLELNRAREDAALYDRMKKAASEVTRLQKLATEITSKINDAQADEAKAEIAAFEATFKNLRVRRQPSESSVGRKGIMGDTFVISYERLRWCMDAHQSVWTDIDYPGFELLDGDMLNYMMTRRPDLIDGEIKALVPGDPCAAMMKFLQAKQRGYLRS